MRSAAAGTSAVLLAALAIAGPAPAADAATKSTPKPTAKKTTAKPKASSKATSKAKPPPVTCSAKPDGGPASQITAEPWGQERLNFTSLWSLTEGQHVTVAVVDSGVDSTDAQLHGIRQVDLTNTGPGDCVGHGSRVAGIIGASDMRHQGVPFVGVAPQATIVSYKVATQMDGNDPQLVAQGIREAADQGAKVINVSSQTADFSALRAAVKYAQSKDALIVAAAGNVQNQNSGTTGPAYPASYPGVVSVGNVQEDGTLNKDQDTQTTHITVTAPGTNIISTYPRGTYTSASGTSFAAPFVAGVAALIRSYRRHLTAAQVLTRIEQTADGGTGAGTGHGMVNPVQAVEAVLPAEDGVPQPTPVAQAVTLPRPVHKDTTPRTIALAVTGGALGLAALVAVGGAVIPAGRRRASGPR